MVRANKPFFYRMQHILQRLKTADKVTAETLADELEVSCRTIMRDIEYMRSMLGIDIEYDHAQRTWKQTNIYKEPTLWTISG